MERRLETNRLNWDSRVGVHTKSQFYDVEGWLHHAPGPPSREIEALGDLEGKSLAHLQCHFGLDTLRWARAGAIVTGVDFSPVAIEEATLLAERAGLSNRASFLCANVYDAPRALLGRKFDVVYVSLGSLCWLPDVVAWGGVVADLLVPGGRLYLHDVHPFTSCLDDDGERLIYSYFEEPANPFVFDSTSTYTDGEPLSSSRTYEWNHSIGEVVGALIGRGLILDSLAEHDWTLFKQFPWLVEDASGLLVTPEGRPRMALSFTVLAHSPSKFEEPQNSSDA
jgi:SAM-dependent methyltransferase